MELHVPWMELVVSSLPHSFVIHGIHVRLSELRPVPLKRVRARVASWLQSLVRESTWDHSSSGGGGLYELHGKKKKGPPALIPAHIDRASERSKDSQAGM